MKLVKKTGKMFNRQFLSNLLISRMSKYVNKFINPWLRKLGMTLTVHHFYQIIPDNREVSIYQDKLRPLDGLDFKLAEQAEFTEKLLAGYSSEYNELENLLLFGYSEQDESFGCGSREFLYSLLRRYQPARIVEIGSGNSSLITLAALKKNYAESGKRASFTAIEPYPSEKLSALQNRNLEFVNFELIPQKLQDVNPDYFRELEANDVLFVDSSHVYKPGSDVEYEFLKIYPYLKKGVFVHIHDIFIPRDYPLKWNRKYFRFWNEQYYLETFLLLNDHFKILSGLNMLHHYKLEIFTKHIEAYSEKSSSGSFWLQVI